MSAIRGADVISRQSAVGPKLDVRMRALLKVCIWRPVTKGERSATDPEPVGAAQSLAFTPPPILC
jgi:hypothetical protein